MGKDHPDAKQNSRKIMRVQTGVRIEKRILKVLKGLAAYHDISLGDLIEGIVLHAFDGLFQLMLNAFGFFNGSVQVGYVLAKIL